jgi:hypothetical protein
MAQPLSDSYSNQMAAAVRRALSQAPLAELRNMLPSMHRRGGHGWQLLTMELVRRPAQLLLPPPSYAP